MGQDSNPDAANEATTPGGLVVRPSQPGRIVSVDVARGYLMFIIIAAPVLRGLQGFSDLPFVQGINQQFSHEAWHGMTYLDTGFPQFIVVVGMTIVVALRRRVHDSGAGKRSIYGKALRRSIVLFLLGVIRNGGLSQPWPDVRLAGVLQRIAICYFLGVIAFVELRLKGQIALLVAILLGYWAALTWIPVPGHGAGDYSFEGNLVAYVDRLLLPGTTYYGDAGWDVEGILSTLPAFGSCLLGMIAMRFLLNEKMSPQEKALMLFAAGAACLSLGLLWSEWLPLNKPMWTSSYVLASGGVCLLQIGVYYQVVDVWKRRWFFPFEVVGLNTLVAYFSVKFIRFGDLAEALVGSDIQQALGAVGPLLLGTTQFFLIWLFLYVLYRNNLIMKV